MTTKNSSETIISKAYCYILQDFFSNQVQFLAGLIFSPAGRQNCKPWSERPQSARADSKSWNNDWSSSILGFRCKKFKQSIVLDKVKIWIRKIISWVFSYTILIEWLHFRPLVLISALADCKCYFYSRGPNCKQNLAVPDSSETARFFFLRFLHKLWSLYSSPCVVLWEINRKRAFPKALRPALIRVGGIYCNDSCVDASFTLLW